MDKLLNSTHLFYYAISATVALAGIIAFLYRYIKKIADKIRHKYKYIEDVHQKVEKIFLEVTPNHGSSIKDKVNSMQNEIRKIGEQSELILYRQRWILNNQKAAIFETDKDGKYTWVNMSYLSLVQREIDYVIGNGWKNVVAQEDRDRVIHNWQRCVEDGTNYEDTFLLTNSKGYKVKVFCAACKTENSGYIGALEVMPNE